MAARPMRPSTIERLGEEGVLFENAYCNFPLCAPFEVLDARGHAAFTDRGLRQRGRVLRADPDHGAFWAASRTRRAETSVRGRAASTTQRPSAPSARHPRTVQRRRTGPGHLPALSESHSSCPGLADRSLGHGREKQVRHRRARSGEQPAVAALHDGLRVAGAPDVGGEDPVVRQVGEHPPQVFERERDPLPRPASATARRPRTDSGDRYTMCRPA